MRTPPSPMAALPKPDSFRLPGVISDELARTLSERIVFLQIAPGAHLLEDQVCTEYNASRSPVREAFRALEADGLVRRLARRGVRVTPMNRRDLEEVYTCRMALAGVAARDAARQATDADLIELGALLDRMAAALRHRRVRDFFDNNARFSRLVLQASDNRTLVRIADGIEKQALRYRYVGHTHTQEMLELSLDGQRRIRDAIAARKPALAQRCAVASLLETKAVIAKVVASLWPDEDDRA